MNVLKQEDGVVTGKEDVMSNGRRVYWREEKQNGQLGDTQYKGIRFHLHDGREVIVSCLSHGLRVLSKFDTFRFEGDLVPVRVAPDFARATLVALEADELFQQQRFIYLTLLDEE